MSQHSFDLHHDRVLHRPVETATQDRSFKVVDMNGGKGRTSVMYGFHLTDSNWHLAVSRLDILKELFFFCLLGFPFGIAARHHPERAHLSFEILATATHRYMQFQ
jgi:hypothetical protein